MGKLHVDLFMTLDGVVQAPGGPDEDPEGGFPFGGWQAPMFDDEVGASVDEGIQRLDALLLGRKTYDIFAGYWPTAEIDGEIAEIFNRVPKYVASRSPLELTWAGTEQLGDDVAAEVERIKGLHDEIHVIGSSDLLQSLLAYDLVDRLNLWVYPITLGIGKRAFGEGVIPAKFALDAPPLAGSSGALVLHYSRVPGTPETGDMTDPAERSAE
ncbi:deaminase [Agromyces protaetiae]|uniref:Deaminase n=1 Tax=Agromyces protaetiae TaxID=2509455 RepID=A0A4P6FDT3_9MICO|nr:dihydrofolate reductase family protein [Agromyces protaetiae]QAY72529.1 deaminase [Agromyces protaetiae]